MSFSGSLLSGTSLSGGQYYGAGLTVTGEWTPYQLFTAGEVGAWYDPSDLTTLYQDAVGTTPVTTPGQVVGLMLDKSRGLALGPELVTNGDFSSGSTGWILASASVAGGQATIQANGSVAQAVIPLETGRWFQITLTVVSLSGSAVIVYCGTNSSSDTRYATNFASVGTRTFVLQSAGLTTGIRVGSNSVGVSVVDNISVRELPGNHAFQTGATSVRPIYAVEPVTGRRNLFLYTEDFSNAAWVTQAGGVGVAPSKTNVAGSSPDGAPACRLQFSLGGGTTSADLSIFRQAATAPAGAATNSVWLRAFDGASTYTMQLIAADGTASNITVTGSWQRYQISATSGGSAINVGVRLRGGQTPANSNTADVLFAQPQYETGSTATAYQRVVSQYDVSESGVASRHYLAFDGIDDWLQTSTITPGTDKAQVFAGVRKLSDAAAGTVFDLNGATATGAVMLRAPAGPTATYAFYSGGSIAFVGAVTSETFAAPLTSVLTGIGDIAADTQIIRVNGAQAAARAADQGTGNYSALPLYIGRRGGTAVPFNGHLYGLVIRFGANLSTSQISNAERWMNGKTGAY